MNDKSVVVVGEQKHLNSLFQGGVQVCTQEFIQIFEKAGFAVHTLPVSHSRKLLTRIRLRLGMDVYGRYDVREIFKYVCSAIEKFDAGFVAINQVNLFRLAKPLRDRYGRSIKIIILSHGNESGDFLHSLFLGKQSHGLSKKKDIIKLGNVIFTEARLFRTSIDGLIVISQIEEAIGRWLGAGHVLFLPRLLTPDYVDWNPMCNRVGFVGTLDHDPNYFGLQSLLTEITKMDSINVRILGRPESKGKELAGRFPKVHYLGYLEDEEMRSEMTTWNYFLNPVFWYSRGASTKLALGINSGIPVITTKAGLRGYEWHAGSLLESENTPYSMASLLADNFSPPLVKHWMEETRLVAESGPTALELSSRLSAFIENI